MAHPLRSETVRGPGRVAVTVEFHADGSVVVRVPGSWVAESGGRPGGDEATIRLTAGPIGGGPSPGRGITEGWRHRV
ncbi:MAG TPA: hypothetical protein VET65_10920 [Candidatus Limnocylindrales bacterium]|nr:hypothetical protein [Candidatus Limnocylindrales bacterium]